MISFFPKKKKLILCNSHLEFILLLMFVNKIKVYTILYSKFYRSWIIWIIVD